MYSLLNMVSAEFSPEEYRVIPGVSSIQLAAAKTGIPWQEDRIINVHGRSLDALEPVLEERKRSFLLTDRNNSPPRVAKWLLDHGAGNRRVTIAERLSYSDERITSTDLEELARGREFELCVMIVEGASMESE
jgi:precorrin-6y C5,15-methyltransferase (decarboxylating) CbiE subunit